MALGGAAGGIGVGRKPTRSGRIIFDGMWSYYNKLKVVDYDYYVKIEGFDKEGNPLTIASPLGYQNWRSMNKYNRNGWSFKKSPDIAFKDAWKNYQVAGGDTFLIGPKSIQIIFGHNQRTRPIVQTCWDGLNTFSRRCAKQ